MKNIVAIAAFAAASAFGSAHAAVVLSDNFDTDIKQNNWAGDGIFASIPTPSSTSNGHASTDLVAQPNLCLGGGKCVDLDGTTGFGNTPSGVLRSVASFGAGSYELTFGLNGNARGAPPQTTTVTLDGVVVASLTLASNAPYTVYSYFITTPGIGTLDFTESGPSTRRGALLDNVLLSTAVPEPATWSMMLLGLFGMGAVARRRARIAI